MKVVSIDEMRQIEETCARLGLPSSVLMENAGKIVAEEIRQYTDTAQPVLFLIGPGNNGGDGLVAARYLHDWGFNVSVYLLSQRPDDDPNLVLVRERNITCLEASGDEDVSLLSQLLSTAGGAVDAVFGTGRSRPLEGTFKNVLETVRHEKERRPSLHIYALDLPSGLDADTGAADPACLHADDTITLGFAKPGLFNAPGSEMAGQITVADIGIPSYLAEQIPIELITADSAGATLPDRPLTANKGTFGRVLVVAGSPRYIGAAYLACNGAMRVGAGLVTLAIPASLDTVLAARLTETTHLPLPESEPGEPSPEAANLVCQELGDYKVLLIGCGLGQSTQAVDFVTSVLFGTNPARLPMVLDADALNILAGIPDWWRRLPDDAIITPHPGEMSRLLGTTVEDVQSDRIGTARITAREWQKTVVLKGAYTIIATPDGACRINPMANPGLASAGTGDVLAGAIAGLRAQGLSAWDAASVGVYLHGETGEMARNQLGDAGMLASDLLPLLPQAIKYLREEYDAAGD